MTSNGNVGVGTSTPQFPLDVQMPYGAAYARFGVAEPLIMNANPAMLGFNLYYNQAFRYGMGNYGGYLAFNSDVTGGFSFATAPFNLGGSIVTPVTRLVITNTGSVGIGTATPQAMLDVSGSVNGGAATFGTNLSNGTGVQGVANVGPYSWGVYGASDQGVGVMGRAGETTSFAGRFENLGGGKALGAMVNTTEVMDVDLAGVHAGPGMTPTPIAHGFFDTNGVQQSGSSNISCSWDSTDKWYACTITGVAFYFSSYTVNVTPASLVIPVIGSANGQLLVAFYDIFGGQARPSSGFSVTVFKQ